MNRKELILDLLLNFYEKFDDDLIQDIVEIIDYSWLYFLKNEGFILKLVILSN